MIVPSVVSTDFYEPSREDTHNHSEHMPSSVTNNNNNTADVSKIFVSPNEEVDGQRMPKPIKDEFESFTDMLNQIKAYAKEVGFSVMSVGTESSYTNH